jgi:tetratricopeptide (TPR) repeat protein
MRRLNLANALAQRPDELFDAIMEYQVAIRLDSRNALAYYHLAVALSRMPGREKDAVTACQIALQLRPDFAAARDLLGKLVP